MDKQQLETHIGQQRADILELYTPEERTSQILPPPPPVFLNNSIKHTSQMLRSHRRDVTIPILQSTTTILSDENLIMAAIG
jgi:hypothetical protein